MRFFNSDGVNIAYVDIAPEGGEGEPILLIHGFASNHTVNWVNTLWVKTLSRAGYRVIALDNRGHGQSEKLYRPQDYDSYAMAADAGRLLDHLDIECQLVRQRFRIPLPIDLIEQEAQHRILLQRSTRSPRDHPRDSRPRISRARPRH